MSKVFILYTGGTFGMKPESSGKSGLVPSSWAEILKFMPAVNDRSYFSHFKDVEFTFETLKSVVDSSNMTPDVWQEIAQTIYKNYKDHSGFVIIHGTDTLAYTASALSFMLQNLSKPVVMTGSQLPVFHPRTDAIANLSNAIYLAGYSSFGLQCIPEVCICFNDDILRGNRCSKTSTYDFEGFNAPNYDHLGWLEEQITLNEGIILPKPSDDLELLSSFSHKVVNVTVFPGYDPAILIELVEREMLEGIVLRTFGSGNIPNDAIWRELVEKCEENNVLILAITQCTQGAIDLGKYKASEVLISPNVVNGSDMTAEAALTKLMWTIGNFPFSERARVLGSDLRGEITTS